MSYFSDKLYSIFIDPNNIKICGFKSKNVLYINNVKIFEKSILPKYFNHSNLKSFFRQLNYYNFKKNNFENNYCEIIHRDNLFSKNCDLKKIIRKGSSTIKINKDKEVSPCSFNLRKKIRLTKNSNLEDEYNISDQDEDNISDQEDEDNNIFNEEIDHDDNQKNICIDKKLKSFLNYNKNFNFDDTYFDSEIDKNLIEEFNINNSFEKFNDNILLDDNILLAY